MKLYMLKSEKGWYRRRTSERWKSCWSPNIVGATIWTTEQGAVSAKSGYPARNSQVSDMKIVSVEVDLDSLIENS